MSIKLEMNGKPMSQISNETLREISIGNNKKKAQKARVELVKREKKKQK